MGNMNLRRACYVAAFGVFLVLLGVYSSLSGLDLLIDAKIKRTLVLEEGTLGFQRFKTTPFPLEFKVYIFNVTNPHEIMSGGKPSLTEVGPYVYDLHKEKNDLKFLEDGSIEYNTTFRYNFNQKKSGSASLSDAIIVVNIPLVGTATMVQRTLPMGLAFLNNAIPFLFPNITDIFFTTTPDDLLFKGINIHCNYTSGPAMPVCNAFKTRAPPTLWRDEETKHYKFALFRHKNVTADGPYRVLSGESDISQLGKILEFKHNHTLNNWRKDTSCTKIEGTDTTIFAPMKQSKDDVHIFVSDICLSFSATYSNHTIERGVPVNVYHAAAKNMASAEKEPDNACRCYIDDKGKSHCLKDGVIDASSCVGGPVIFSNPHFLEADPEYLNGVQGMKPNEKLHKTFILLEPRTGAPVEGRKRMQMNLRVTKIPGIKLLNNLTDTLVPILWLEEGTKLEGPIFEELQDLFHVMSILRSVSWSLVALGLLVTAAAALMFLRVKRLLCFGKVSRSITPVDTTSGQKMTSFGETNRGSDAQSEERRPYNGAMFPQLSSSKPAELASVR